MRRWLAASIAATVLGAGCASCSSDEPSEPSAASATTVATPIPIGQAPVLIEKIRPAIAAVEAELGGPQQYFEVNATPTLVNIYVAASANTQAIAYVYMADVLQAPADPELASGPTFTAAQLTFDETRAMAGVVGSLSGSTFRLFAALGVEGGGVRYVITVTSALGGEFQVDVGPTGVIIGTDQMIDPPTSVDNPGVESSVAQAPSTTLVPGDGP